MNLNNRNNGLPAGLEIRNCQPEDHPRIIAVLKDWWGGRDLTVMLPRLFLIHFCNTSFVIEKNDRLIAFLIGFLSPARRREGYIHFAGVHPEYRGRGVGRFLYRRFFELCQANGRDLVRACTSPVNKGSIAYHQKMGFAISRGHAEIDGVPVVLDYNRPDDQKVLFEIRLQVKQ
ncbi:MAG: GNAT family N-acetyltransferase [Thermodesulfobacteriota bacterium]